MWHHWKSGHWKRWRMSDCPALVAGSAEFECRNSQVGVGDPAIPDDMRLPSMRIQQVQSTAAHQADTKCWKFPQKIPRPDQCPAGDCHKHQRRAWCWVNSSTSSNRTSPRWASRCRSPRIHPADLNQKLLSSCRCCCLPARPVLILKGCRHRACERYYSVSL